MLGYALDTVDAFWAYYDDDLDWQFSIQNDFQTFSFSSFNASVSYLLPCNQTNDNDI
jgi:DUF1365 family protein